MASNVSTMLRTLVEKSFYDSCYVHKDANNNEENRFCADCCLRLCSNCLPDHKHHSILQIRRYMYSDALRYIEARKIFDCSKIQLFQTNGSKVLLLHPKQRVASTRRDLRCLCLVRNQHIKSTFLYCSLVCKLTNVTASSSGQRVYADGSNNLERSLPVSGSECVVSAESSVEENLTVATTCDETIYECVDSPPGQKRSATTSRKLHGRKCVPQRSPLF